VNDALLEEQIYQQMTQLN